MFRNILFLGLAGVLCAGTANAALIFDLSNGTAKLPGEPAGSLPGNNTTFLTASGQTLSDDVGGSGLTVTVTPGGGFKQIEDLGLADTNGDDTWNGGEGDVIDFVFNQDIKLDAFYFSSGVGNRVIGGQPILDFDGSDTTLAAQEVTVSDRAQYRVEWTNDASNTTLLAGDTLRLTYPGSPTTLAGDKGWVGAIEVTVIPEPSAVALLGIAGLCLCIVRRRRG